MRACQWLLCCHECVDLLSFCEVVAKVLQILHGGCQEKVSDLLVEREASCEGGKGLLFIALVSWRDVHHDGGGCGWVGRLALEDRSVNVVGAVTGEAWAIRSWSVVWLGPAQPQQSQGGKNDAQHLCEHCQCYDQLGVLSLTTNDM